MPAEGFKTITVKTATYEKLKQVKETLQCRSIAEAIEELLKAGEL